MNQGVAQLRLERNPRSGQPRDGLRSHLLFGERQELSRALTSMGPRDTTRHHDTSAERQEVERFLRPVRELLPRMCKHGMVPLMLEDVWRFVQRPGGSWRG